MGHYKHSQLKGEERKIKLKAITRMMLTLLLTSMLTVAFIVPPILADAGIAGLPGDSSTIQEADGDNPSNLTDSQEGFLSEGFNQNVSAKENPRPCSVDEDRWNFNRTNEWADFAKVDGDSAELIVGVNNGKPNSYPDIVGLIGENGGDLVGTVSMGGEIRAVVADIPLVAISSFVTEVRAAGLSRYIEPNMRFKVDLVPNDPDWPVQWGPRRIEADYAWNTTIGDPSVVVAVVDTGVDWDHPDLAANIWNNTDEVLDGSDTDGNGFIDDIRGWDFVDTTAAVWPGEDGTIRDNDPMDFHGHGTHCSGIVAAVTNNSIGIAGVCWNCKIMAVRAGYKGADGYAYLEDDDAAAAIVYAADNGANVISMSWGSYYPSEMIYDAVKYAYDSGVLLVAAAGNDATSIKQFPAAYDEVIAVSATQEDDNPVWWTNFGDWIELAAPGVNIYSTVFDDSYTYMSGTSMSTPHVAGVAALILSQFPNMTRDQLRLQLRYTADDLGLPGFDEYYGYGRVNARRAVEEAPPDHDLLILNWERPPYVEPGDVATVGTTVFNFGVSNESDITVQLLVNGSVVDNATIGFLASGESATVNCSWSPMVEGMYNVTSYVVPVLGETVTENNIVWAYVYVGFPVKAFVLDSAGNDLAEIITNWQVLNTNWYVYGSTMIYIDYTTLDKDDITYDDIAATGADVLIISCAYNWEFTDSEIDAITRYVYEGHGLIATAGTLYYLVPNNNKLAPLFGLNETTMWDATGTDLLHLLNITHPLFRNVPNPFVFADVATNIPFDWRWDSNELVGGKYLALGHYQESAIVTYRGLVYISPWLEVIPPYYHHHLQLLYNAITWSRYQKPQHELIVSLEAPQALKPGESALLNATVSNIGLSNETSVELQLLINGVIVDSATISELWAGDSYTLSHLWTPTVEGIYNVTAYAIPVPNEEDITNNVKSVKVFVSALFVALFQNYDSWGYPSNEEALDRYGVPYVVFSSSDFGRIDLSAFTKVVIASDQDQAFYNGMNTYRWWFEDYVSNGGVLEIHAADWGWHGGGWVGSLPGGLQWVSYYADYVTIVDPTHPVVTIPNLITNLELDGWSASVHGYFGAYPADAHIIIIEDSTRMPAYLEFGYGSGFIIASSQTLEWAYRWRYSLILENSLLYMPAKYEHDLAVTLEAPAFLEPGSSVLLNATVRNRGLNNETSVELQLLINGTVVNSTVITELLIGESYTISYLWTPTVEATYNVTAYAPPVLGENFMKNNQESKLVGVFYYVSIFVTDDNWPIPPDNDLDYYMFNTDPKHPIEWAHSYDLPYTVLEATLQIYAYDVDSPDEVDEVYFNGLYLGRLQGADGQWMLNSFMVPTSYVQSGINIVTVYVDVTHPGEGYWGMTVDWADLTIRYLLLPGIHDVAIISVTTSATEVYEGQIVNITVVAINEGNMTETFDVATYYDSGVIEIQTVPNLTAGANVTLTFSWNTTGVRPCINYTIRAVASVVPGETDTADNTLIDGTVKVKMVGDLNGDGIVDIFDAMMLSATYGSYPGHPRWNQRADLNNDSIIDIFDAIILASNFGRCLPPLPEMTTVYVDPQFTTVAVGNTFTVNVNIYNVTNLAGYEFMLFYDTTVLDGLDVTLPPGHFFTPLIDPENLWILKLEVNDAYNATHGRVWVAVAYYDLYPEPPKNGSGTLVTITFKATAPGSSALRLDSVKLGESIPEFPFVRLIPCAVVDGYVNIISATSTTSVTLRETISNTAHTTENTISPFSF